MSWLTTKGEIEGTIFAAVRSIWSSVQIRHVEGVPVAVSRYLDEVAKVYVNGRILFARFELTASRDFAVFATQRQWQQISFVEKFLNHSAVRATLPELTEDVDPQRLSSFEPLSTFTLDGELARLLVDGGAYEKFRGMDKVARQLGADACAALFGDRYQEADAFVSWQPWSSWFMDVAWDRTFLVIDRRVQAVFVLAATDTD